MLATKIRREGTATGNTQSIGTDTLNQLALMHSEPSHQYTSADVEQCTHKYDYELRVFWQ